MYLRCAARKRNCSTSQLVRRLANSRTADGASPSLRAGNNHLAPTLSGGAADCRGRDSAAERFRRLRGSLLLRASCAEGRDDRLPYIPDDAVCISCGLGDLTLSGGVNYALVSTALAVFRSRSFRWHPPRPGGAYRRRCLWHLGGRCPGVRRHIRPLTCRRRAIMTTTPKSRISNGCRRLSKHRKARCRMCRRASRCRCSPRV